MPLPNPQRIIINGPFWTAEATVIASPLAATGHNELHVRDLFVDAVAHTAPGAAAPTRLAGDVVMLCFVRKVQIKPSPATAYVWQRGAGAAPSSLGTPADLEAAKAGGQLAALVLSKDPDALDGDAALTYRCVGGEIPLHVLVPQANALASLYAALGLARAASVPAGRWEISVHASGVSLHGLFSVPWLGGQLAAPLLLAPAITRNPVQPLTGYRLGIEIDRLTDGEASAIVAAWQTLSRYLAPHNPLLPGDALAAAPRWVTLEIGNPLHVPGLYWKIADWGAPLPRPLFAPGSEMNLILADQEPYDQQYLPTSLAHVTIDEVGIAGSLTAGLDLTLLVGDAAADPTAVTYRWEGSGGREGLTLTDMMLAFSPVETPKLLREHLALPQPDWSGPSPSTPPEPAIPVEPAVLWGFLPLERGWAQLPIPNLSEQIYLDAELSNFGVPGAGDVARPRLVQGAVSLGNTHDAVLRQYPDENAWNVTLVDARQVTGHWRLAPAPGGRLQLAQVDLRLAGPDVILNGFFWLSTGQPTVEDALPDFDDWPAAVQSVPLYTHRPATDLFPAPVVIKTDSLDLALRVDTAKRPSAVLGGWAWTYAVQSDMMQKLIVRRVLPADIFSQRLPLVWLRHAVLPMIQALPLTQVKAPPNYPNASRQLAPFELAIVPQPTGYDPALHGEKPPIPATFGVPDGWRFGVATGNGASQWAAYLVDAGKAPRAAAEWSGQAGLPMAALSLPGLQLASHGVDSGLSGDGGLGLAAQYRFDLPYTDQLNALAERPQTQRDPALSTPLPDAPPEAQPGPLQRDQYEAHWSALSTRASLASVDAAEAFSKEPSGLAVQHLVEPFSWPAQAELDLAAYPGSLTVDNAGPTGAAETMAGDAALGSISGRFAVDGAGKLSRLPEDGANGTGAANGAYQIVAGSAAAYAAGPSYRDQRGLLRSATQSTPVLLRTPVQFQRKFDGAADDTVSYHLLTAMAPFSLALPAGEWQFWFRDLPVLMPGAVFDRDKTVSPAAEDINDPDAMGREFNFLNGYEWRLGAGQGRVLPLYNLRFFPLTLERAAFDGDQLQSLEIVGRLQLPVKEVEPTELTELSNAVRLAFALAPGTGKLALDAVEMVAAAGEWPLRLKENEVTGAPALTWQQISLDKPNNRLVLGGVHLRFYLFDANWALPLEDLAFPAEPGAVSRSYTFSADPSAPVAATGADMTLDLVGHAHAVTLDLALKLGDRAPDPGAPPAGSDPSLLARYEFKKGNDPAIVQDTSGVNPPLNLRIQNPNRVTWLTGGGVLIKQATAITSVAASTALTRAIKQSRSMTVEAWIKPANATQTGPAHIVSLSKSDSDFNFALRQATRGTGSAYSMGFRPLSPANPRRTTLATPGDVLAGDLLQEVMQVVVVFADGAPGIIYVDGVAVASDSLDVSLGNWDETLRLVLGNDAGQKKPWLGELDYLAVYNRGLSAAEVTQHYLARAGGGQPATGVRPAFSARLRMHLLADPAAGTPPPELQDATLFEDVPLDRNGLSLVYTDKAFEFRWRDYSETASPDLQLLPGMHVRRPQPGSGETGLPGVAVACFDLALSPPSPAGAVIPALQLRAAFVEMLISCRWGKFLQDDALAQGGSASATVEAVFGSSAGDLTLDYITQWQSTGKAWEEVHLLNGMLEVTNLISWPLALVPDPQNGTLLRLPVPQLAAQTLPHARHTIRVLFNQHEIPSDLPVAGQGSLIFDFAPGHSWQFLATVEHQIVEITLNQDLGSLRAANDRRWTALQEVRFVPPARFRRFLQLVQDASVDREQWVQNYGSLNDGFRRLLVDGTNSELVRFRHPGLLVEASAPHWVRLSTTDQPAGVTNLQYLPGGAQNAFLSAAENFAPSATGDPQWLLLTMPFLGRLQGRPADLLDAAAAVPGDASAFQVDPVLLLHKRLAQGTAGDPPLGVAILANCAPAQAALEVRVSIFDTRTGHTWSRLDPLSLEENWYRLQHPMVEPPPGRLRGVMATLAATPARLSRPTALRRAFDAFRRIELPAGPGGDLPALPATTGTLIWRQGSLYVLQASSTADGAAAAYAWPLVALQFAGWRTGQPGQDATRRYPAATLLPVWPQEGHATNVLPVSFSVSPYLGLDFVPAAALSPRLLHAELLCLDPTTNSLVPVCSQLYDLDAYNEATIGTPPGGGAPDYEMLAGEILTDAAPDWARAVQPSLAPGSPVAILRFRIINHGEGPTAGSVVLATSYAFEMLGDLDTGPALARRMFRVRAPVRQLRHRQGQYGGHEMPAAADAFELAPPQVTGVQPLYLLARPETADEPAGSEKPWPWGLSALRLSVRYTQDSVAALSSLPAGGETPEAAHMSLWWQAVSHHVQYRSASAGEPAAGLPALFRAPAIRSLLPVLPAPPAVNLGRLLPIAPNGATNDAITPYWQPVLPGSLRYLVLGARPGAMFSFRASLMRTRDGQNLVSGSVPIQHRMPRPVPLPPNLEPDDALRTWASRFEPESSALFTQAPADEAFYAACGTRPMRRLRLAVAEPANGVVPPAWDGTVVFDVVADMSTSAGEPLTPTPAALGPWLQVQLARGSAIQDYEAKPADLALFALGTEVYEPLLPAEDAPSAPLPPAWIDEFRRSAVSVSPGATVGRVADIGNVATWRILDPANHAAYLVAKTPADPPQAPWELRIYREADRFKLRYRLAAAAGQNGSKPQAGNGTAEENLSIRVFVFYDSQDKEGLKQTLTLPLRSTSPDRLRLPFVPRYAHFEDPEYNRHLASTAATASRQVPVFRLDGVGNAIDRHLFTVTLAADRRQYNPDSEVAVRYDWLNGEPFAAGAAGGPKAELKLVRVTAEGAATPLDSIPLVQGALRQTALARYRTDKGALRFAPGDVLEMRLEVGGDVASVTMDGKTSAGRVVAKRPDGQSEIETNALVLRVDIVGQPVMPVVEAGYALLHAQKSAGTCAVECARFAWSPAPERVELICPDDLLTETVRRRAIFHWLHVLRPERGSRFAVQKITASGATHVPSRAEFFRLVAIRSIDMAQPRALTLDADGQRLYVAQSIGTGGVLGVYDATREYAAVVPPIPVINQPADLAGIHYSTAGNLLYIGSYRVMAAGSTPPGRGAIRIVQVTRIGQPGHEVVASLEAAPLHDSRTVALAASRHNEYLFALTAAGILLRWSQTAIQTWLAGAPARPDAVLQDLRAAFDTSAPAGLSAIDLAASPDGRWLVAAVVDQGAKGYLVAVDQARYEQTGPASRASAAFALPAGQAPSALDFSADSRHIYVLCGDSRTLFRIRLGSDLASLIPTMPDSAASFAAVRLADPADASGPHPVDVSASPSGNSVYVLCRAPAASGGPEESLVLVLSGDALARLAGPQIVNLEDDPALLLGSAQAPGRASFHELAAAGRRLYVAGDKIPPAPGGPQAQGVVTVLRPEEGNCGEFSAAA